MSVYLTVEISKPSNMFIKSFKKPGRKYIKCAKEGNNYIFIGKRLKGNINTKLLIK